MTALPLADDGFDIASSEWVFQMVERLDRALAEGDYFDTGPRKIRIDEDYDSTLTVFDRTVADLHDALVDAGFEVRCLIEHRRAEVEETQPADSDLPEILWDVPESVRFWAVVR
nr:hypothetical protein [Halomicroarcula sp. ZS-22-S1]